MFAIIIVNTLQLLFVTLEIKRNVHVNLAYISQPKNKHLFIFKKNAIFF